MFTFLHVLSDLGGTSNSTNYHGYQIFILIVMLPPAYGTLFTLMFAIASAC